MLKAWAHRVLVAAVLTALAVSRLADAGLRLDFGPNPLDRLIEGARGRHKTAVCPRCPAPPRIDGNLDDPAWRNALLIRDLNFEKPVTRVKLCYDDRALYIGVACAELPGRTPTGKPRRRDGRVWTDDCIEMWLDPARKGKVRYQFAVSIAGSAFDQTMRGHAQLTAYNPEWRRAVTRAANGWSLEVEIPRKALELTQWPERIGFNIGRNGPGLRPNAWSPAGYGDTASSSLVFQGITRKPAAQARDALRVDVGGRGFATVGDSLRLTVPRPFARACDRWIDADIELRPRTPLRRTRVRARLFPLGGAKVAAEATVAPANGKGTLAIDLRAARLKEAQVVVELFEGNARTGMATVFLSARDCDTPLRPGQRIPVRIDLPPGVACPKAWPVMFGVPFPSGALWDLDRLRVVDGTGREIPAQKEITGRWAREGAIEWVRFDALVSSAGPCFVEVARPGKASTPASPVRVTARGDDVTLDTGVARYVLGKGPSPIKEIWLGGRRVACGEGTRGLYVKDQTGRVASASARGETLRVEARGPVAACVRFEGYYRLPGGEQLARHITRVEAFAGQPFAKVTHTLVISRDTNMVWFKDIGWEFAVEPGAEPRAVFGVSRESWAKSVARPLDAAASAFMIQDRHYRFGHGDSHFSVAAVGRGGKVARIAEGKECGDWALLSGRDAGLAVCCRETARQHPKEFELSPRRLVFRFFSDRGGEELDFRAPALVKKWNLQDWHNKAVWKSARDPKMAEKVAQFQSNGQGWSKTHELCIVATPGRSDGANVARVARLNRDPAYGHPDPRWIRRTEVMGPLHPRDRERFPEAEQLLDAALKHWTSRVPAFGEYGFMDYYTGPHLGYAHRPNEHYPRMKRYRLTYTLRPHAWLPYARSGDRALRDFARETNRVFLDSYMVHWDAPGKTRGLYASASQSDRADGRTNSGLPFYWGDGCTPQTYSSTNLNQFVWLYHLCGDRRAKDGVLQYAEGVKRKWTPALPKRTSRVIMLLRAVTQAYRLTWDPTLKAIAEHAGDFLYDPEGDLALTKDRPYSNSLWKTQVDVPGLVLAWRTYGRRRYLDAALKVSRFWWRQKLGMWPLNYANPQGFIADLLYRHTGDPSIPEAMKIQLAQAAAACDPATTTLKRGSRMGRSADQATFLFQGIPYAQDLIVRAGALNTSTASWVAFHDYGSEASAVVRKGETDFLDIDVLCALGEKQRSKRLWWPSITGGRVRLEPLFTAKGRPGVYAMNRVDTMSMGATLVRVPKDNAHGDHRIYAEPAGNEYLVMCHSKTPLVVHAPGYWKPLPESMRPYPRVYFRLPKKTTDAQILFEGSARLFDPSGKPVANGAPRHGWIDLPSDRPGLWSFQPVDSRLLRVRNLPPFFAFGDPADYFEPGIPWRREKPPPPLEKISPDTVYVPGAIATPGNKALHLHGRRRLTLKAGDALPAGKGSRFLPFHEGTIEFFFKPDWGVLDMPGTSSSLMLVRMATKRHDWRMEYVKKGHRFWAHAYSDGPSRRMTFGCHWPHRVLEPDEWIHIAWTWGQEDPGVAEMEDNTLVMRLFVNGKTTGLSTYYNRPNLPADRPLALVLGYADVRAAFDELRISDIQRYRKPFRPPQRDRELAPDEHTRALFHFNGDVKGESHGHEGPLPVTFRSRP